MTPLNSHSQYRLPSGSSVQIRKPGEEWREHVTDHDKSFELEYDQISKVSGIIIQHNGWELQCDRIQLEPCKSVSSLLFEFESGLERIAVVDDHGFGFNMYSADREKTLLHVKAGDELITETGKETIKTVKIYRCRPSAGHLCFEVECGQVWLQGSD